MKTIIGLDISTTGTGLVVLNKETKNVKCIEFNPTGDIQKRIRTIYKEVKEYLKDIDYDLMCISKASYTQTNANIAKLEGLILSLSIDKNVPDFYQPDISWYVTLPNAKYKDERETKKTNSLIFMMEQLNITDYEIDKSLLPKEVSVKLKDGTIISDNISDAFCIVWQYDEIKKHRNLQWQNSKLQTKINEAVKTKKKLKPKIEVQQIKIKNMKIEIKLHENQYKLINSKLSLAKIATRKKWLIALVTTMNEIVSEVERLNKSISEMRKEKNGGVK